MSRRAKQTSINSVLAFAVLVLFAFIYIAVGHRGQQALARGEAQELSANSLRIGLGLVALTPDELASAGLTTQETSVVVVAAAAHLGNDPDGLETAGRDLRAARAEVDRLTRLALRGHATDEDREALAQAKTTLAATEVAYETYLDGLFNIATLAVPAGKRATLSSIRSQRACGLPAPLLAAEWTEAERVAIREALDAERIAGQDGGQTPQSCASLLSSARGEVADAIEDYDTLLEGVSSTFNSTVVSVTN